MPLETGSVGCHGSADNGQIVLAQATFHRLTPGLLLWCPMLDSRSKICYQNIASISKKIRLGVLEQVLQVLASPCNCKLLFQNAVTTLQNPCVTDGLISGDIAHRTSAD